MPGGRHLHRRVPLVAVRTDAQSRYEQGDGANRDDCQDEGQDARQARRDRTGWRTVGPTLGGFCIAWFGWQSALALQLAAGTHLVEVSIDVELKKIARVITRSTRSRRDRTHETQAGHVKAFGEGINHPHCCFSPDVVVYPCRQEACLLTVLASNIAHGKAATALGAALGLCWPF